MRCESIDELKNGREVDREEKMGGTSRRTRAQAASCSDLGRGGEEESTARLERKENESLTAYFVGFRFFFYLIDTIPPY